MHQKLNYLERHSYVPITSKYPCSAIKKIVSINEVYWNSGKSSQNTNWVVNAAIEFSRFNQTDTTGPSETVLITGDRRAEFH